MSLENISSAMVEYIVCVCVFCFSYISFFPLFFETWLPDKAERKHPRLNGGRMNRFVHLQKDVTACCTWITCANVPPTKISPSVSYQWKLLFGLFKSGTQESGCSVTLVIFSVVCFSSSIAELSFSSISLFLFLFFLQVGRNQTTDQTLLVPFYFSLRSVQNQIWKAKSSTSNRANASLVKVRWKPRVLCELNTQPLNMASCNGTTFSTMDSGPRRTNNRA